MTAPARDVPLTLSAVAGVLTVAAVVLMGVTDSRPVAFRSGSMSPTIPTGAAALVHRVPADDLRVGDVVTVPVGKTFVTHRVVRLTRGEDAVTLQLQGDANRAPDAQVHRVQSVERVVGSVPWAGYLLGGLAGPAGWFLGAVYALWLLSRLTGWSSAPAPHGGRHKVPSRRHPVRRRALMAGAALITLAAASATGSSRAWAAPWTDTAGVSGTTLTATTVPAPVLTCRSGVASVAFEWAPVPGATSYTLYVNGAPHETTSGTSATVTALIVGGSAHVVAHRAFGSPVAATWTSVASNAKSFTVRLLVLSSCS